MRRDFASELFPGFPWGIFFLISQKPWKTLCKLLKTVTLKLKWVNIIYLLFPYREQVEMQTLIPICACYVKKD